MATAKAVFYKSLRTLLEEVGRPAPARRAGPGRPSKVRAETAAVILHLYKDQVRWLDDYAGFLETLAEGNVHLSRVEIVRGLLMGLAEFTVMRGVEMPVGMVIQSERDLQRAVAVALAGGAKEKKVNRGASAAYKGKEKR